MFLASSGTLSFAMVAEAGTLMGPWAVLWDTGGAGEDRVVGGTAMAVQVWEGTGTDSTATWSVELKTHGSFRLATRVVGWQTLSFWYGLQQVRQWGLANPENSTVHSSKSAWSQLKDRSFASLQWNCSSYETQARPWNWVSALLIICWYLSSSMERLGYQHVGYIDIQPFVKSIDHWFSFPHHEQRRGEGTWGQVVQLQLKLGDLGLSKGIGEQQSEIDELTP